jgi:sRNA-binding protein
MSRNGWFEGVPETIAALAGLFPGAFVEQQWLPHKPLKLGIRDDLVAAGIVSETEIGRALQFNCHRPMYLRSCIAGAVRIDLSGKPSGVVSETDAVHAAYTLAKIWTGVSGKLQKLLPTVPPESQNITRPQNRHRQNRHRHHVGAVATASPCYVPPHANAERQPLERRHFVTVPAVPAFKQGGNKMTDTRDNVHLPKRLTKKQAREIAIEEGAKEVGITPEDYRRCLDAYDAARERVKQERRDRRARRAITKS